MSKSQRINDKHSIRITWDVATGGFDVTDSLPFDANGCELKHTRSLVSKSLFFRLTILKFISSHVNLGADERVFSLAPLVCLFGNKRLACQFGESISGPAKTYKTYGRFWKKKFNETIEIHLLMFCYIHSQTHTHGVCFSLLVALLRNWFP